MMNKMVLAILLGASSTCALAQGETNKPINKGYSQSGQGDVTRSEFGLCWRSGSWTPNDAVPGCDGPLKPPVANPIAPDVINSFGEETTPAAKARCDFSMALASDQTFAFGKASLTKPARQKIITELREKIAACQFIESIGITGHSDPIGNAQANQRLSEQRALNVANLLREEQISAPIHTAGVGSTQSINVCRRGLNKAKQIACFAPDRRVEIVVSGPKK